MGNGPVQDPEHLLRSPADVHRHFCSTDVFEVVGNQQFFDNWKTYLAWPGLA